MSKRTKRSSAAEADVRRLFMELPKHKWPMAPDHPEPAPLDIAPMRKRPTRQDRARMIDELQATLDAIGTVTEDLKPYLLRRKPPTWAVEQYRRLSLLAHEVHEMRYAMEDAEEATVH
jgi:hypothetical protein